MMRSARPATGMLASAWSWPTSSAHARFIARIPAPPVSTSVPSISKRTSLRIVFIRIYNRGEEDSMRLSVTALAIAFASSIALAQAPQGAQTAPAPAPKTGPTPPVRAHAVIKGEGITGTADLVEHDMGAGRVVDVTVSVAGLKPGQHG